MAVAILADLVVGEIELEAGRMKELTLDVDWCDALVVIRARNGAGRSLGTIKGVIEAADWAMLSDIIVQDRIEVRSGWLGLRKQIVSYRNRGVGTKLLERFEKEMAARGIREIRGNLVAESGARPTWLIGWYERRGYEFRPEEHCGSWVPPDTQGMVIKAIEDRVAPSEGDRKFE